MSGLNAGAKEFTFNPGVAEWSPGAGAAEPIPAAAPAAGADDAVDAAASAVSEMKVSDEAEGTREDTDGKDAPAAEADGEAAGGKASEAEGGADTADAAGAEAEAEAEAEAAGGGDAGEAAAEGDDGDAGGPEDEDDEGEEAAGEGKAAEVKDLYDPRDHLNVVFIGHVDAGKSTLSGNILYLTGQVDARTIEKFEREAKARNRESWFLAFIMDTNEEERAKGKTVEVGRATFETDNRRFTVLDAPGHKNYVPNMIAGAAQADVGVLVISARKGEFETGFERGGQTREHAMLAKTLGVRLLIVAINKMDDPTVNWSETRYNECVDKLSPFLKSAGYNVKKHVFFLPLSALTGAGVKDPVGDAAPWYEGSSLLGTLDELKVGGRDADASVRVPVLDKFSDRGTMVMGKVEAGTLTVGQKLLVMPTRAPCKVDGIFINDDAVTTARPGENVTVKLKGVDEDAVHKGFVLSAADDPCAVVSRFEAQLMLLDLGARGLMTAGYNAVLHVHTCMEECTISEIVSELDKKSGKPKKGKPMFIKSGSVCTVRIETAQTVCVETFAKQQQLGRFTLRDEGRTIAIGKILRLSTRGKDGDAPSGGAGGSGK